jgi:branched-chain amino acid transport system ATP-binding protein
MLLRAEGVGKSFGGFQAVDGAHLEIEPGEIVGIIGPNGAGKSTFFGCIVGDLKPSAGTVRFLGHDVTQAAPESHARLGMARTFQVPQTFEDLTVLENVMVGAFLRHPRAADARAAAQGLLEFTGLADAAGNKARSLGTPGRKRLEIARALATGPKLLLLDEALAGLTPAEIRRAIDLVRAIHARGIALVIVEHIMEVIVSLAQRVVVFNQGRIIASGLPPEVMRNPQVIAAYLGTHGKKAG